MKDAFFPTSRRAFLGALGAAFVLTPGIAGLPSFAADLIRTPRQTEGPFYPDRLPLDTDNDLLIINEGTTPAAGTITHLSGRVLDPHGETITNAIVEIWQVDGRGIYLHTDSDNRRRRDANFQGFGRVTTGDTGAYYFRTLKPVSYPGRTPHIHFKIKRDGKELLTTQCYIKGESANETDGLYRSIRNDDARAAVTVDFATLPSSKKGELAAKFDIVLGATPEL